ncbi:ATP-binding cassette domain-containing protein [Chloracidobacterium validum]|uniref:ATP-binding cassette domain-containing protein n=2 Tax=Chloracidobacterium validum TaxID=2821543 RepID=A0ABX8BBC2_9BACT|nr:ATP-binding cassette domain-containing protein [Chloracidobacterium validum]
MAKYGAPYVPYFALAFFCLVGAGSLALIYPLFVGTLFGSIFSPDKPSALAPLLAVVSGLLNRLFPGYQLSPLDPVLALLTGILVVQSVLSFGRTYLLNYVGEKLVADVRRDLYRHLLSLDVTFFANRRTGELTSRIASDVTAIQNSVTLSLAEAMRQVIVFTGGTAFLFWIDWRLACLLLALIPVLVVSFAFFGRNIRRRSTRVQDALAEATAILEETIAGIRTVQSFAREPYEVNRYETHITRSLREALGRALARGLFNAAIVFVLFGGFVGLLWYSGNQVLAGKLTAEQLIQFLFYAAWVGGALGTLAEYYGEFNQTIGASRRVVELFETKPAICDRQDAQPAQPVSGLVEVKDVHFTYPGRTEPALDGITITARPGEVIALVGPSGAGKSTLISLLPRFYDVTSGAICVDGRDVRAWKLADLRSNIGIVPQETTLFSGTVYDNIAYGKLDATPDEVERAAQAAHAHAFITGFPQGYQTIVGERGVKLSGGQRQRIAIARALLKNPRILILDEATSSLDSESERYVQEALDVLMEGRTTFVIAHRLSTVQRATRIVVMAHGRIIEEGTHQDLLAREGMYKKLYKLQFRDVPEWILQEEAGARGAAPQLQVARTALP